MSMAAENRHAGAPRPGRVSIRFMRDTTDIAGIVEMGRWGWDEVGDGLPFDREVFREALGKALRKRDHCLLQAELDGRLIGGLAGVVAPHFHSPAIGASLLTWFVVREHRGSAAAVKLLRAFGRWAKEQGAVRMYLGITSGVDMPRTDKLLKRMGFRFRGGNYLAAL